MRLFGLTNLVLPIALMSEIHDWSGLALGFFVAGHLILNRAWILTMTRKILAGEKMNP
jgi:succinate dehydrogenase/fumarate reductase cytochrome b subunit